MLTLAIDAPGEVAPLIIAQNTFYIIIMQMSVWNPCVKIPNYFAINIFSHYHVHYVQVVFQNPVFNPKVHVILVHIRSIHYEVTRPRAMIH